jgi:hypothetical protein
LVWLASSNTAGSTGNTGWYSAAGGGGGVSSGSGSAPRFVATRTSHATNTIAPTASRYTPAVAMTMTPRTSAPAATSCRDDRRRLRTENQARLPIRTLPASHQVRRTPWPASTPLPHPYPSILSPLPR